MKTVLELGQLEKEGLIKIHSCGYMIEDGKARTTSPILGYTIEIPKENLDKVPENLKYNWMGTSIDDGEQFGVFI